jgi:hypothetical protein
MVEFILEHLEIAPKPRIIFGDSLIFQAFSNNLKSEVRGPER